MAIVPFPEQPGQISMQAKPTNAKNTRSLNFSTVFFLTCRKLIGIGGIDAHPQTPATNPVAKHSRF
jgi:hypothetical protein